MQDLDFKAINASLMSDAFRHIKSWLPNGKKEGSEWRCGSVRGDKGRSFAVNIKTGRWGDFASNDRGGDLISLYAAIHNMSSYDAAKVLSGVEVSSSKPYAPPEHVESDIVEVIPSGKTPPKLTKDGLQFVKQYAYHNQNGDVISFIQRYDRPDGKKEIIPWRSINGKIVAKHLPKPRPLYRLNEISRDDAKNIMITEGEKTCDAARSLFVMYKHTTWSGGTANVQYVDWSPLAKVENILIVPDADEPGIKAAMWIAEHLNSTYKIEKIKIVDTRDKPQGWDIADDADAGVSSSSTFAFLKENALPWKDFKEKLDRENAPIYSEAKPPIASFNDPIGEIEDDEYTDIISDHDLLRNGHFRFLGIAGERYYFYKYKTAQIIDYTSEDLGNEGRMVGLADKEFWLSMSEGKGDWKHIRNVLVRISEDYRFDNRVVRRIGVWKDSAGDVIHLGDRLMTKDGIIPIRKFKSEHIYELCDNAVRITRYRKPATVFEARKIIDIISGSNWSDPSSAKILAGWMFSSLMCASMRWRSHVYIIGPAGSGKTWLIDNVVSKFFGDFKYKAVGSSTEASVRQGLASAMIPVVFDEAEAEDAMAGLRRKAIFELARQAASADENSAIIKGGAQGTTKQYLVRSPFLFASINATMEYADESRTAFLSLKPIDKTDVTRRRFRMVDKMARETLTPDYTCAMLGRALQLMPKVLEAYEIFSDVAFKTIAQDSRHAEQMSFMLVGSWFLENDEMPTEQEATKYVEQMVILSNQRKNNMTTEERLISAISQIRVKYQLPSGRIEERLIGELIVSAYKEGKGSNADLVLRRYGLRIKEDRLLIFNNSDGLRKGLKDTPFYSGWDKVITNVMGAREEHDVKIMAGMVGSAVSIPLKSLMGEINYEKSVDNEPVL